MIAFTSDQWLIVGLVFLLGIVVGAAMMAGGKWKRRYRDEQKRAGDLEAEKIARADLPPEEATANVAYLRKMLAERNTWKKLGKKG